MANKRLEGENLQKFEEMVLAESTPEDIAAVFGISVSSVHNYKRAMKQRGHEIPDVRGKRPVFNTKTHVIPFFSPESLPLKQGGYVELKVNNVSVMVSNNAKNISVETDRIIIEI
jgi:hypothetical protein